MGSRVISAQLAFILGILVCWIRAQPMDIDSMMDGMQMGAIIGIGAAKDFAEDIMQAKGSDDTEIALGPLNMKRSSSGSLGRAAGDDDDRKRRRRSTDISQKDPVQPPRSSEEDHRHKRSPCWGRRQQAQATAPPPTMAPTTAATTAAPARRRRKRSPDIDDSNDIDENIDIIPVQRTFGERAQELHEKIHQIMNNMLDAMAGVFESLKRSIQNAPEQEPK